MPDFDPDKFLADTGAPAKAAAFDPDQFLKETSPGHEDQPYSAAILDAMKKGMSYGGKALNAVSDVVGRPIRAGIEAGTTDRSFGDAYDKPPGWEDLYKRAGLSDENAVTLPLVKNPWGKTKDEKYVGISPAGAAASVTGMALDPLSYVAPEMIGKGATKLAGAAAEPMTGISERVASYLKDKAADRAVKATTGQNVGALRRIAQSTARNPGDVDRALANIRKTGSDVLDSGAIGAFDRVEDIAPKLAKARQESGARIGQIGDAIDAAAPGAVSGQNIQKIIEDYRNSIPQTPKGMPIREKLAERASGYSKAGPTPDGAPLDAMSFKNAQFEKGQYKYNPADADSLVSNQDVSNKIRGAISKEMENAADNVAASSPELADTVGQYKAEKGRYQSLKNASDAATDRTLKNQSIRFLSPSDHGVGGAVLAGGIASGHSLMATVGAAAAAGANKLLRERGSSTAAVTLNKLSQIAASTPEALTKYAGALGKAAQGGTASLIVTHHLLMNNDPEYAALFQGDAP